MIVTFSGVDCAGKSTQIAMLLSALRQRGRPAQAFWHRPGYSAELNALRSLVRKLIPRALPSSGKMAERQAVFDRGGVSSTWVRIALADLAFQYAVKIRLRSYAGACIIADRYFDDAQIDLVLRFPGLEVAGWPEARVVRRLVPRPAHAFLLSIPHAEMLRRMAVKNEPYPDSPSVREARYAEYQRLVESGRYHVLDAGRSAAEIHAEVLTKVLASPG